MPPLEQAKCDHTLEFLHYQPSLLEMFPHLHQVVAQICSQQGLPADHYHHPSPTTLKHTPAHLSPPLYFLFFSQY